MTTLQQWEKITQQLAGEFITKYFGNDADGAYWIGDDTGGVLSVNDYFFSLDDIVQFTRYKYPVKKMFKYFDEREEKHLKNETFINIKNYLKLCLQK